MSGRLPSEEVCIVCECHSRDQLGVSNFTVLGRRASADRLSDGRDEEAGKRSLVHGGSILLKLISMFIRLFDRHLCNCSYPMVK